MSWPWGEQPPPPPKPPLAEKEDLQLAFTAALREMESQGSECTIIENLYDGQGRSAVILVRGDGSTFEIAQAVRAVMERWEAPRAE